MTTLEVISAIKAEYPRYSKATHSMIIHGDEYGVKLRPPAQRIFDSLLPSPKKPPHRKLDARFQFRLRADEAGQLREIAINKGYATMQDFLADVAKKIIEESRKNDTA